MPNGTTIQSSHTCNLLLTDLPPHAGQAHILPGLVHNSLISVGQFCYNGCIVTLTHDQVTVTKNKNRVMHGSRDPKPRLWRVNLNQKSKIHEIQCNHSNDNNNQKDLINYLLAACLSPVKSTLTTAIKNGNFITWPGLTEHAVEKHCSKSTATAKGHFNQQRKNARATQIKTTNARNEEYVIDHGIKIQFIYAATIDAGQIYTDQTGRFPVVSS
jgi:hypothetical protein